MAQRHYSFRTVLGSIFEYRKSLVTKAPVCQGYDPTPGPSSFSTAATAFLLKGSRSPIPGDRPSPPEQRKCHQQDACAFEIIADRRLR
jgi:hypothetical protein